MSRSALSQELPSPPLRRAPVPMPGAAGVDAPPALLLGEHFVAALLALAVGALGLPFIAGDLARGAFFAPRVVAVVHLFVLGWLILSIFGSLCQFLPVAIGKRLRWERGAHLSFAAQLLGLAAFVLGLLLPIRALLLSGASLLALAFALFGLNLGATLLWSRDRSLTWWSLALATLFLLITPVYGLLLALNLQGDIQLSHRFLVVGTHAHVALVGFVFLVMLGVAHRLLPMFLLSHGANEKPGWAALCLFSLGAGLLSIPLGGGGKLWFAGLLIAAGCVSFFLQAAGYLKHRKRRAVDAGVRLAMLGLASLALALLLAPFALSSGLTQPRLLIVYFLLLIGGLSFFVAGHYYKIVPFLVWYHRFGPLVGEQPVPTVSQLWSEKSASWATAFLLIGLVGLAVSILLGAPVAASWSSLPFLVGVAIQIAAMIAIVRKRDN